MTGKKKKTRSMPGEVAKKSTAQVKENPFELRVTKRKFDVLGRKIRGEKGSRAVARAEGEARRRQTLLVEVERRGRAGGIVDRRFGEGREGISDEDRQLRRFMAAQARHRARLFNLDDDDGFGQGAARIGAHGDDDDDDDDDEDGVGLLGLTHGGRPIDDFEDKELADSAALDAAADHDMRADKWARKGEGAPKHSAGAHDGATVRDLHFGGGDEGDAAPHRTRKEIMEEVISKSKLHRYEREKEREDAETMVEQLDEEFDAIAGLLTRRDTQKKEDKKRKRDDATEDGDGDREAGDGAYDAISILQASLKRVREEKANGTFVASETIAEEASKKSQEKKSEGGDEYDRMVREMGFERRAHATDRLKTQEERELEEKTRLERLENERLRRMRGEEDPNDTREEKKKSKGVFSADQLEDEWAEDTRGMRRGRKEVYYDDEGNLIMPGEGEEESGEESESESGSENDEEEEDEEEDDDEGSEDDDDDDDDSEGYSDIELASESDESGEEDEEDEEERVEENREQRVKERAAEAAAQLPFVFSAPDDREELNALLEGHSTADQLLILERIRKCHPIAAKAENREKLATLLRCEFGQFTHESAQSPLNVVLVDGFARELAHLAPIAPVTLANEARAYLVRARDHLMENALNKNVSSPTLSTLLHCRLFALLFPPSDLQHPVTTPTALFLAESLSRRIVASTRHLLTALFTVDLLYHHVEQSKRLVPEVIAFLTGVIERISIATESQEPDAKKKQKKRTVVSVDDGSISPPVFAEHLLSVSVDSLRSSSLIDDSTTGFAAPLDPIAILSSSTSVDSSDVFKLRLVRVALSLLSRFVKLYGASSAAVDLFSPPLKALSSLSETLNLHLSSSHPLVTLVTHTLSDLTHSTDTTTDRVPLALQRHRPTPIRMYAPAFDDHYEIRRHRRDPDKDKNDLKKLKYMHKQEKKGALRELRRDAAFLSREHTKKVAENDADRAGKVKRLYSLLQAQQSESNAEKRERRRVRQKSKK